MTPDTDHTQTLASERDALASERDALASRVTDLETQAKHAEQRYAAAVDRYRQRIVTDPHISPAASLVTGTTVEEIDQAAARAAEIIAHVLAAHTPAPPSAPPPTVPAGGSGRLTPDLARLSPIDKLRLGVAQRTG